MRFITEKTQGELFIKKPDESMEKLGNFNPEPIELSPEEDDETESIFATLTDTREISFSVKIDPIQSFYLAIKFLGGVYWMDKVQKFNRRKPHIWWVKED